MKFFYNMYGSDVGELRVELETGDNISTVWIKQGDQGVGWHSASVSLSSAEAFWVILNFVIHVVLCIIVMNKIGISDV